MDYANYTQFEEAKLQCRACSIGLDYDQVVLSDGCKDSPAVGVIGEAPGKDELTGKRPFVGKAGKLLRSTINQYGFRKSNAFISNVIPCRPLDNQFPKDISMVTECAQRWLMKEIRLLRPRYLLLVGAKPLKFILGMDGITSKRGSFYECSVEDGYKVYCMPTFHPSYVLRKQYSADGPHIRYCFEEDIYNLAIAAKFNPKAMPLLP